MLIDSHCHLDRLKLEPYNGDLGRAIIAAREAGVQRMLCIGIDMDNASKVVSIAEQYDDIYASVGIHPLEKDAPVVSESDLLAFAAHPKVVGIGETGLDYYYSQESASQQQENFVVHLQAAAQSKLPVIVHSRDAREDTLNLLREHSNQEVGGVLHCFTESWEMARAAMDMNFFISISGIVTFRNAGALREVVRKLPLDRLLIETDAPYLAPVPHRGKPNEPKFLPDVARFVAELKGVSEAELVQVTSDNFFRLFPKAK